MDSESNRRIKESKKVKEYLDKLKKQKPVFDNNEPVGLINKARKIDQEDS